MTRFWDDHINGWLDGNNELPEPDTLGRWFRSYVGKGRGEVTLEGMPEPWIGDLTSPDKARMVTLGLNPGAYIENLQSRSGLYAEQVRKLGSFTKWAATNPYLIDPWRGKKDDNNGVFGKNRYHVTRANFARNWLGEHDLQDSSVVLLEMYPWHSIGVTAPMRSPRDIIKRFVLDPIDELTNVRDVFAFGRPWESRLNELGLKLIDKLGKNKAQVERDYGSKVASRSIRVFERPSGKRIIVGWHSGSAGPPNARETDLLKKALG